MTKIFKFKTDAALKRHTGGVTVSVLMLMLMSVSVSVVVSLCRCLCLCLCVGVSVFIYPQTERIGFLQMLSNALVFYFLFLLCRSGDNRRGGGCYTHTAAPPSGGGKYTSCAFAYMSRKMMSRASAMWSSSEL